MRGWTETRIKHFILNKTAELFTALERKCTTDETRVGETPSERRRAEGIQNKTKSQAL